MNCLTWHLSTSGRNIDVSRVVSVSCSFRSAGGCLSAQQGNQISEISRLAGLLDVQEEASRPAELPLCRAARRVQYVSVAAEVFREITADCWLPAGGIRGIGDGLEGWPLPVLWDSGIRSPLAGGDYISSLGWKYSQLEGVYVRSVRTWLYRLNSLHHAHALLRLGLSLLR